MFGKRLINTGVALCPSSEFDIFGDSSGVALYQLNSNADDSSGNYDGTATDVTYVSGHIDNAGSFNGSSSYLKAASALNGVAPSSDYSVSVWFKINAYGQTYPTIFAGQTGGDTLPPYLWISSSILRLHGYEYNDYTNNLSSGVWYNAVMINQGTSTNLYIDGVLQTPTSRTFWGQNGGQFFNLGGVDLYPTTNSFNGLLDQVRIFNKAVTSTEVTTLYNEVAC